MVWESLGVMMSQIRRASDVVEVGRLGTWLVREGADVGACARGRAVGLVEAYFFLV